MGIFYKEKIERTSSDALTGKRDADSRARIGLQRGVLGRKTTQRLEPPNWRTTFLKKRRTALNE